MNDNNELVPECDELITVSDVVTIPTEEYKLLVRNSSFLELIHLAAYKAKYASDIEQVVRLSMGLVGFPKMVEIPEER